MNRKGLTALALAIVFLASATLALAAPEASAQTPPYVLSQESVPMTCRALLAKTMADGASSAALWQDGKEVLPGDYVATGQTLMLYDENGAMISSQQVVVAGDVVGSGAPGIQQVLRLARALTGKEPLQSVYLSAGDMDGSGAIEISDVLTAAQALAEPAQHELSERTVPMYLASIQNEGAIPVSFVDGNTEVPYVSMETAALLLKESMDIDCAVDNDDGVTVFTNPNGSWAEVNFKDNVITFLNYDRFFQMSSSATFLDIAIPAVSYLTNPEGSYERNGLPVTVNLSDYGIQAIWSDGTGYLPLQTVSDIFTGNCLLFYAYNGEAVFVGGSLGDMEERYYSVPTGTRSPELADFTYREFCLALDLNYGLKEQHNITDFDTLFLQTGLKERLMSPDPAESGGAVSDLMMGIFGDLHSSYSANSYLLGPQAEHLPAFTMTSLSWVNMILAQQKYAAARAEQFPEGTPPYQEIGDTAFVTFDSFIGVTGADYGNLVPTPTSSDTIELLMYAHQQIMRENSPIENVVIDLSNNGGGQAVAAIATAAWFLGGTVIINLNSSMTEAQASTRYGFDLNQDGVVDENDTVASKRLFCLTSPVSFSCGNLVPAVFSASDSVTMIGKPSGGGACAVSNMCTADGTILTLSGPRRISTLTNGSYYDVDKGVRVDVPITQIEHFYDRELLTDFIAGIY